MLETPESTSTPEPPMLSPIVPERFALAAVCVLYSAFALVAFDAVGSPAIKALDNRWLATTFLALLFVAGSVSIAGTLRRWPRLEAIGQFALAGDWACFATLGWLNSGARATAFTMFLYTFAAVALVVWWQQLGGELMRSWLRKMKIRRAMRKAAR
jgi:hypothetical protein